MIYFCLYLFIRLIKSHFIYQYLLIYIFLFATLVLYRFSYAFQYYDRSIEFDLNYLYVTLGD